MNIVAVLEANDKKLEYYDTIQKSGLPQASYQEVAEKALNFHNLKEGQITIYELKIEAGHLVRSYLNYITLIMPGSAFHYPSQNINKSNGAKWLSKFSEIKTSESIKALSDFLHTSGIVDDRITPTEVNVTVAGWFLDNKKTIRGL